MTYSARIFITVFIGLFACTEVLSCTLRDGYIEPTVMMPTRYKTENLEYAYTLQLLALALKKTEADFGPCTLVPLKSNQPINRTLLKIQDGQYFDVVDSTVSTKRDNELLPIRFPVYRGLMGYRVAMIRENEQHRFDHLQSISDLNAFTFGSAVSWKDREILLINNFSTVPADGLNSLYRMLPVKRFDILLRGAHEVIIDRMRIKPKGVNVEKTFVIAYPLPVNFYVSKNNTILATRVLKGLERALADGDAEQLFFSNPLIKETLSNIKLNERHFFYLCNPTLEREIKLSDDRYWFKPWPKHIQECETQVMSTTTVPPKTL